MSTSLGELILQVELDEKGLTLQADRAGDRTGRAFGRAFTKALDGYLNEAFGTKLGKMLETGIKKSFNGRDLGRQFAAEVRAEFESQLRGMRVQPGSRLPNLPGVSPDRESSRQSRLGGSLGLGAGKINAGGLGGAALGLTGMAASALGSTLSVVFNAAQALTGGLISASAAGLDLGKVLKNIEVNASATNSEMAAISQTITQVAGKFGTMPQEVAEVTLELTRMGVAAKDLPDRLNAVFALGGSTGEGSDISSKLINQIKAIYPDLSDMQVADVMSVGANQSPGGLEDLANSLKYVAPVAAAANLSLEDLTATVVQLQTAGLNGSTSGTALRALVKDFSQDAGFLKQWGVDIYDAQGKARQFSDVLVDIAERMATLSDEQRDNFLSKFSANSKTALLALTTLATKSPGVMSQIDKAFEKTAGTAEKFAANLLDTPAGSIAQLLANATSLMTKFGMSFGAALKGGSDFLNQIAQRLLENDSLFAKLTTAAEEFQAHLAANPKYVDILTEALTELASGAFTWVLDKARELITNLERNPTLIQDAILNAQEFVVKLGQAIDAAVGLAAALTPVLDLMTQIRNKAELSDNIDSMGAELQSRVEARRSEWDSGFLGHITGANGENRRRIEIEEMVKIQDERDGYTPGSSWTSGASGASNVGSVGGANPQKIQQAVDYYLQQGLTRQGAAYLVGNLIQESNLDPSAVGDGGQAMGLAQWHPDRRYDMPSDFAGQLAFVLKEMERDSPDSLDTLRRNNASISELTQALKNWERYGVEGSRYEYGAQLLQQLQGGGGGGGGGSRTPSSSASFAAPRGSSRSAPAGPSVSGQRYGVDTTYFIDDSPVGAYDFTLNQPGASNDGYDAAIPSPVNGTVTDAGYERGYGNFVSVRGENGLTWFMAHLKELSVRAGQQVTEGMTLGLQGSTGRSTGEHIHLELTRDNIGGMQNQITDRSQTQGLVESYIERLRSGQFSASSAPRAASGGVYDPGLDSEGNPVPLGKDEETLLREARANRDETVRLQRELEDRESAEQRARINSALQFGQDKNEGTALGDSYGRQRERMQLRQSGVDELVEINRALEDLELQRERIQEDAERDTSDEAEGAKEKLAAMDELIAKLKQSKQMTTDANNEALRQFDEINQAQVARARVEQQVADASRNAGLAQRQNAADQQAYLNSINNPQLEEFVSIQNELATASGNAAEELRPLNDEINNITSQLSEYLLDSNSTPGDPWIALLAERRDSLMAYRDDLAATQAAEAELIGQRELTARENLRTEILSQSQQATFDNLSARGATFEANDYMRGIRESEINQEFDTQANALANSGMPSGEITFLLGELQRVRDFKLTALNSEFQGLNQTIAGVGRDALGGFFEALLTDVTNISGAIQGLIQDLLSQFAKIASQRIIMSILGGPTGATGASGVGSLLGFADGGLVPSTPGSNPNKDSVLALLQPGEFVLSKQMLRDIPRFANGGYVGAAPNTQMQTRGNAPSSVVSVNVPITIQGNSDNSNMDVPGFARVVEAKVMEVISRESRPNGRLNLMARS